MPKTRKDKNASPSRSLPRPPAAEESPRLRGSDFSKDGDAVVARFCDLVDQLPAPEEDQPPAAVGDRDAVLSSASPRSAVTAVEAASSDAAGCRAQERLQAIEHAVLVYGNLPANRVSVEARTFFMGKVLEAVAVCWGLRAEVTRQGGMAYILQDQLAEARREAAELRRRLAVAEARLDGHAVSVAGSGLAGRGPAAPAGGVPAPSGAGGSAGSPAGRMDYAAALRAGLAPSAGGARGGRRGGEARRAAQARRLSNTGFDDRDAGEGCAPPSSIKRGPARQEHQGRDASSHQPCNPCVKFTGVDPDIFPDDFLRTLNERNEGLDLDLDKCKVRVTFGERAHALTTRGLLAPAPWTWETPPTPSLVTDWFLLLLAMGRTGRD
ncbi:uncharacterized protein [Dermacentor albipictus]|uniref:uncharacterized protein n=1 Tax=Dermacentor albipictus TaxID=60249 RepID=UPI0038FD2D14